MPLQNRVDPFGELFATPARGTLMGNRGGRLHDDDKRIGTRRWASKHWICCEIAFRGRERDVMESGYTELFFLDEVTALAAGHRPCFECRRADFHPFAAAFARGQGWASARSDAMDTLLHAERLDGRAKRRHPAPLVALPDGAAVDHAGKALARRDGRWLAWSPAGWTPAETPAGEMAMLLTPPAIVAALKAGFTPRWHA